MIWIFLVFIFSLFLLTVRHVDFDQIMGYCLLIDESLGEHSCTLIANGLL